MPVMKPFDISVDSMKPGDIWDGLTCDHREVKQKYTWVYWVATSKPTRFDRHQSVEVLREVPTDAELAIKKAQETALKRQSFVDELTANMEAAIAKQAERREDFAKQITSGYQLSAHELDKYLQGEAAYRIWSRLAQVIKNKTEHRHEGECDFTEWTPNGKKCVLPNPPGEPDVVAITVTALQAILDSLVKTCLYGSSRRMSRSTSTMSNLFDDVDMEAAADFINGLKWNAMYVEELRVPTLY